MRGILRKRREGMEEGHSTKEGGKERKKLSI
jgi:hypothetical protein